MDREEPIGLTGATRLHVIIGDPIAQVKSPGGMTAAFAARGEDAILVPVQVAPADLADFLSVATRLKNLDGIVVTIPHKFACFPHCATTTARAAFLGAVNIMRRASGGWHGDMVDGMGFVQAAQLQGMRFEGRRALLIGAGGAGSAIGLSLVEAGVSALAVHDPDAARRGSLVERLRGLGRAEVCTGTDDPSGFDFVANASPAGMRADDPLPIDADRLSPECFVACVITAPAVSPIVAAARARGCPTSTGIDMYRASQDAMVEFLVGPAQS